MNIKIAIAIGLIILFIVLRKPLTKKVLDMTDEQISPHFYLRELSTTSTGLDNTPNATEKSNLTRLTTQVLEPIRTLLGVPIRINSAFRSELVNKAVGGVSNSQHRLGMAADIVPVGISLDDAMRKIYKSPIPFDQLIIETNETGGRWIHVSYQTKPRRQALIATDTTNDGVQNMLYKNYTA